MASTTSGRTSLCSLMTCLLSPRPDFRAVPRSPEDQPLRGRMPHRRPSVAPGGCPADRRGAARYDRRALEDSPSGLWRSLGKRVGIKPSGVRISHPPQVATWVLGPIRRLTGIAAARGARAWPPMDTVVIDVDPATLPDLLAVARGAPVELTDAASQRMAAGRRVVDGVLASGRAVYGLTTGVGHSRDVRVPDQELVGQQYMIVRTHSGGFGRHLPTEVVRAAMAVRLVGLTRGGSGASPG